MVKKFITTHQWSITERVMANSIIRAIRTISPRTTAVGLRLCWRLRKEADCR